MKAAVTEGENDIKLVHAPLPETSDYRCLCKIQACASCSGTDVKIIQNKLPFEVPYPGIPGHESVGTVIRKGEKARYVKEGDVYLRPTAVYPEERLGEWFSSWGGYAEYGLITDLKAFNEDNPEGELSPYAAFQQKIPDDIQIPPGEATMIITLKEISSFTANVGIKLNSSVLLLGSGPVAKSMCYFAKIFGAGPVIAAGRNKDSLRWIEEAGADLIIKTPEENIAEKTENATKGKGVDFILDTTGAPDILISNLGTLKAGGKAAPYATYPEKNVFGDCPAEKFIFTGPSENLAHDYLVHLTRSKTIDLKMFYTHTLPFEKIKEGFELIKSKTARKIVFEMEN